MPPFGHDLSHGGVQKMDGYGDTDAWVWPQPSSTQPAYSNVFDPALYANFAPQLQPPTSRGPPRHHALAATPTQSSVAVPPPRVQGPPSLIKAQPAFKPTWQGFLDTTKDAMTVVEAALQGRLSHISRRPHDKERAEMLTSGTVLVYEENASGIKRWTDAVHWSPSRVMNNCLIYRQLVRALKPEEKKTALNPSCGTKRKRKESAGPNVTKTGENINQSDDEFENPGFDGAVGEADSKVYTNFAQSLNPDQQRRFCGSLIDSYEFKEGGLMKKTISVKYQGTHHHVISYYSLEDVVSGKLKRPYQDPKLADIHPRPELLNGWKVSLEDEEGKDLPLVGGYGQQIQPSHLQHHVMDQVTQVVGHGLVQTHHPPLHLQVPDYWHSPQVSQYATQPSPHHYTSPQSATSHYSTQQPPAQSYSPHHYQSPASASPQYSVQTSTPQAFGAQSQPSRHYSYDARNSSSSQYTQTPPAVQYPASNRPRVAQPSHYSIPPVAPFNSQAPAPHNPTSSPQHSQGSFTTHEAQRRSSLPMIPQAYSHPQYGAPPHPHSYYVADEKYAPNSPHGY
jgi:hypothetical protein